MGGKKNGKVWRGIHIDCASDSPRSKGELRRDLIRAKARLKLDAGKKQIGIQKLKITVVAAGCAGEKWIRSRQRKTTARTAREMGREGEKSRASH